MDNIKKQYDNIKQRAKTDGGPHEEPTESQKVYLDLHDTRPNVVGLQIHIDTEDPNMLVSEDCDEGRVPSNSESNFASPPPTKSTRKRKSQCRDDEVVALEIETLKLEKRKLLNELELFPIQKAKLLAEKRAADLQVLLLERQVEASDLLDLLK